MSSDELVYINWHGMIKPEKVVVTTTSTYGKFVCEPLERGFGITIGNSLRRIILSSLHGAAIVSVKFEEALHQYSVIPDVREDVSELIMNLKAVRLKVDDLEDRILTVHVKQGGDEEGFDHSDKAFVKQGREGFEPPSPDEGFEPTPPDEGFEPTPPDEGFLKQDEEEELPGNKFVKQDKEGFEAPEKDFVEQDEEGFEPPEQDFVKQGEEEGEEEIKLSDKDFNENFYRIRERDVTAAALEGSDPHIRILNPDQHIATLSKGGVLKMTLNVKSGKGYALASANKDLEAPVGTIPIDSVFSPIKRVKYVVGTSRIGQKTDYDKLTLEVWTDGTVSPEDSVAYAAKILKEQMNPFINFDEDIEPEQDDEGFEYPDKDFNENLYRSVDELELSVRSSNCLKNAQILKIYQLVQKTESEMLKTKNFGRKSLNEIKEVLTSMDLSLGIDIDGFEPPPEDEEDPLDDE